MRRCSAAHEVAPLEEQPPPEFGLRVLVELTLRPRHGNRRRQTGAAGQRENHSHSMVPGGFEVTSSTTRLTSRTSFVMRLEILASTS